jgi:PelA/Pel-15E family pectate lyase
MNCRSRHIVPTLAAICLAVSALSAATPPPKPWPAHPFEPVTAQRIAALPPSERPAWQAYWDASQRLAAKLPPEHASEFSPLKPMTSVPKGGIHTKGLRLDAPSGWYATEEARTIADRVVAWQSAAGAWKKGIDYTQPRAGTDKESSVWISGTFDNDATIFELRFLALVISANRDAAHGKAWRDSFAHGLDYVFAAQYPNGGFPQIYPLVGGYHDAVTYNDDAGTHALELLRDVAAASGDYAFVEPTLRATASERLQRGLHCVLATQLHDTTGRRTVWCQQYDALTLKPCAARNFEPVADCSQESAEITQFLMSLPQPSSEVVAAVDGAIAWFRRTAIPDLKWIRIPAEKRGELVPAPGALVWARLYEPGTTTPIFGDRDRTIHYALSEISVERRAGYNWYGDWPADALKRYDAWRTRKAE